MESASQAMSRALVRVAEECRAREIVVDPILDPNGTCLVGPEQSQLFTSLGQLEAKRTSTNPDLAGLMVHLLTLAGVAEGDRVGVGASGSFPGLLVATLAALEALDAEPVTILSLGASSYGATRPDFHLGDLHALLEARGLVRAPPAAVSLGGGGDVGRGLDPGFREALIQELRAASEPGTVFLQESDLRENVLERMALYGTPAAFVNIGGAEANLGTSPEILDLPPGLFPAPAHADSEVSPGDAGDVELPPEGQRGVLFEMAYRGVPVIHLLHVRGLALRYGLSWDPIPLPRPGSTPLVDTFMGKGALFWLLFVGYVLALAAVFGVGGRFGGSETVRQPG
jgi:poly-gamma-glutamate system protein